MRKRFTLYLFFLSSFIFTVSCAPRATHYKSGSIEEARISFSMAAKIPIIPQDIVEKEKEKKYEEIDHYKAILEQEFQFIPPVRILCIIPPPRYSWQFYGYSTHIDSFNAMFFKSLSKKFKSIEFVSDIELASSLFSSGSMKSLREIAAYYRADEVMLASYDLQIVQPSSCLGFWPGTYLNGLLSSEIMLIDTRTGFFLVGRRYSYSMRTSPSAESFQSKELKLMQLIVDELADAIVADLLEFYETEIK